GTDSRASNPDLSLWREVQFLHQRHPDCDPQTLVELATVRGARALGLDAGTLTPGRPADLAVVSLPSSGGNDFEQIVFAGSSVVATMRAGRWV
ncbi:MAG: amidohydrolase family protein, partial [Planctomycetaceae bacterium]